MDIYGSHIIDLAQHPLNYGALEQPAFSCEEDNPLCGDIIRLDVALDENDKVIQVAWQGNGCVISQAAASLLSEEIKHLNLAELLEFPPGRLLQLLGVPLSMARRKCALLALKALQTGAIHYLDQKKS
jgi:nitrogen fixation protein NifU and related proteins